MLERKREVVELREFSVEEISRTLQEIGDVSKVDFKVGRNIIIEEVEEKILPRERIEADLRNSLLNAIEHIRNFNRLYKYKKQLNEGATTVTIQSKDDIHALIAEMERNLIRENLNRDDFTPEETEVNNFVTNYIEYNETK